MIERELAKVGKTYKELKWLSQDTTQSVPMFHLELGERKLFHKHIHKVSYVTLRTYRDAACCPCNRVSFSAAHTAQLCVSMNVLDLVIQAFCVSVT